jgi:regulatory protein
VAKITALRASRGRGKRVKVFLDGRSAFSLEAEVALKEGLKVGQELSAGQIEALNGANQCQRCLDAAARYLSYRPRSQYELRKRLLRRGFDDDSIELVLAKLKERGLINDGNFAQFWRDNRQSFSPRSQWLTRLELKQKGVPSEVIEQVVSTIDDADNAYRAANNRARSLTMSDYQSFRRRLSEYLRRRGFSYGVINKTIERLWQERGVA